MRHPLQHVTGPRLSTLKHHADDVMLESDMATGEGNDWRGSIVDDEAVAQLRRDELLDTEDDIAVRVPAADEIQPAPRHGKAVVFVDHLERGLALPVSPFFRQFLDYFVLQPHHLGRTPSPN